MQYDFDSVVDRSRNHAAKYDERIKKFGTSDVLPLWVADMDFRTAQPIIDALHERAEQGIFGYTTRPDFYFDAICGWQERRHGWKIDKSLIGFCLGVVPALSTIVRLFSEKGDKILIQTPVYSEFYDVVELLDRTVVENPLVKQGDTYVVDFDDFEKKLPGVKIFLLCSPHNPVGVVWSREDLKRMAELCIRYGVLMVSDEIHSDLVFWDKKHIPTASVSPEIANSIITCISGTKTFNLAGLQASSVVYPNKAYKEKFESFWFGMDVHRNNSFSLVAMEAAFNRGDEWLEQLIKYLEGNFIFIRDYCKENIPKIVPNVPDATYLVWLDCTRLGMDNAELRRFMIEKAKVGLNEGYTFHHSLSGYMRLNAACPRSLLMQAMEQLKDAVNSL